LLSSLFLTRERHSKPESTTLYGNADFPRTKIVAACPLPLKARKGLS